MTAPNAVRRTPRERLLIAADELFYGVGIHAVGIDLVLEHAGVAKGSLYKNFGSKEELVCAYLESRHASYAGRIEREIARHASPRDRLLSVFDAQARLVAEPGYRGCAFINAGAEARSGDRIEQAADAYRAWIRRLLTDLADMAGVPGSAALARQLHMLYDGGSVSAGADRDPSAVVFSRAAAEALLDAAVAGATDR